MKSYHTEIDVYKLNRPAAIQVLRNSVVAITLAYSAVAPATARSPYVDATAFVADLESEYRSRSASTDAGDSQRAGQARGYVFGIVDALNWDTSERFFCVPDATSPELLLDRIRIWAEQHRQIYAAGTNRVAFFLVADALGASFPCIKGGH